MAKQVQLTDGRTALFDDGEPLENIDRKLKDAGLERVKGGTVAKIMEPVMEGTSALLGFPGAAQQAIRQGWSVYGREPYQTLWW
jgi:hypothetical protein